LKEDKITVALLWLRYSGNVTSVNDLVLGFEKERFNVIFIYLRGYGIEKNLIEEAGYDVFNLSGIEQLKGFRFSILFKLVGILKEHNVDIIHCHGHKATVYGTIAAKFAKTPIVMAHVHGLGRSRNLRRKLTNFLLFRKIDRIICVANSVREDVLKNNWLVSSEKLSVLENSVDYERFANVSISKEDAKQVLGLPSDAFVFGTIARLAPTKGLLYLIEAFQKVKERKPSAHVVLVGEGPLKKELQQQVAKAGIGQSVHFLGQRSDIPELLRAMDAFVLPSIGSEGMPRVILEAMAANVPCVATKVGGITEIISNENMGTLVPPKDSAVLFQAMVSAANMPKDRLEKQIKKAQEQIRKFFTHNMIRVRLAKLYEDEYAFSQADTK
jgi:glycosyltransferase involved in cell wall biosynthesis